MNCPSLLCAMILWQMLTPQNAQLSEARMGNKHGGRTGTTNNNSSRHMMVLYMCLHIEMGLFGSRIPPKLDGSSCLVIFHEMDVLWCFEVYPCISNLQTNPFMWLSECTLKYFPWLSWLGETMTPGLYITKENHVPMMYKWIQMVGFRHLSEFTRRQPHIMLCLGHLPKLSQNIQSSV